jgi:CDP-diacylglycerol--glycerol-3-phosphate 3-phosphatidyltransferase
MNSGTKLGIVTLLTLARVPLVLLFFVGALVYSQSREVWVFLVAFACLVTSAVTDIFDGWLARRFKVETTFGAHADPLMDKVFYLATFPLVIYIATKNAYGPAPHLSARSHAIIIVVLALLFLTRDQWVTFLRSIGSIYNVSGQAHWSGKLRTIITFPLLCTIYYVEEAPWQFLPMWSVFAFEAVAQPVLPPADNPAATQPATRPAVGRLRPGPRPVGPIGPAGPSGQLPTAQTADLIFVGKLTTVKQGPTAMSYPPIYTSELIFEVKETLRGNVDKAKPAVVSHSARQDKPPEFAQGGDYLVFAKADAQQRLRAVEVKPADDAALKAARLSPALRPGRDPSGRTDHRRRSRCTLSGP